MVDDVAQSMPEGFWKVKLNIHLVDHGKGKGGGTNAVTFHRRWYL